MNKFSNSQILKKEAQLPPASLIYILLIINNLEIKFSGFFGKLNFLSPHNQPVVNQAGRWDSQILSRKGACERRQTCFSV